MTERSSTQDIGTGIAAGSSMTITGIATTTGISATIVENERA
jgi:hypothetical protein